MLSAPQMIWASFVFNMRWVCRSLVCMALSLSSKAPIMLLSHLMSEVQTLLPKIRRGRYVPGLKATGFSGLRGICMNNLHSTLWILSGNVLAGYLVYAWFCVIKKCRYVIKSSSRYVLPSGNFHLHLFLSLFSHCLYIPPRFC